MKAKVFIYLMNFFLLFFSLGCNDSSTEPNLSIISGKYSYTAYDHNNSIVATGYLTISINDSMITGIKNIQDITSEHQPESGNGNIRGKINELNKIEIFLLETGGPTLAIYGNYKDKTIDGKRVYWSNTGIWIDTLGNFESKYLEK